MSKEMYPRRLEDLGELTGAERMVLDGVCAGEPVSFGDGTLPAGPSEERSIRAGLIRLLLLGGCDGHRTHEKGVEIEGAFVTGVLDLEGCRNCALLWLFRCRIEQSITAMNAELGALGLNGSAVPGLNAQGATVKGDVFLSEGFHASGEVSLSGAEIGGQLSCIGGRFENADGDALDAQDAKVTGVLFWKQVRVDSGNVALMRAHVGVLSDDLQSWPSGWRLQLDGFRYDAILGAEVSSERRLEWLARNQTREFQPQPYEQLAKVLGEMGHRRERSLVLTEMERRLRGDIRRRLLKPPHDTVAGAARKVRLHLWCANIWLWDTLLRGFVGYGHRPHRAVFASLAIVGATWWVAGNTWDAGDMVPNSPVVLVNAEWQVLASDPDVTHPAAVWAATIGKDYETFHAFTYAADVFIPLIDFGQEPAWAPSTERGWWGRQLYWLRWVVKSLGWLITALGAAAVTGIIRRDP